MIGIIISGAVRDIITSIATNRRYLYTPDAVYKATDMNPQAKAIFKRNLQNMANNAKIKSLLKQLEKEVNNAMNR